MSAAPDMSGAAPQAIIMADGPAWRTRNEPGLAVHTAGDARLADAVVQAVQGAADPLAAATQALAAGHRFGAGIIAGDNYTLAFTDHCRSVPVFYAGGTPPVVGSDARRVRDAAGRGAFDPRSVLQAATAGYVPGPNTLIEGLYQLKPGEVLYLATAEAEPRTQRSFVYLPENPTGDADHAARLHDIIDRAIEEVIAGAGGAPVWVPLSGGLDSRLILAKLAALGCPNLHSFSYGPKGNADAMVARDVARQLEVPWQFVPTPPRDMREFFAGRTRREYWTYADGLSTTPNNQDLLPLMHLRESGALESGATIVNGQTGDFISGGHIPAFLFDTATTAGALIDAIIARHHGLWRSLLTEANRAVLAAGIRDTLGLDGDDDVPVTHDRAIALWERYEFEGRQASYIVNGQRSYDFLGLRWALPLWDGELVRFWRDVPHALKRDQKLYRETWQAWDHRGVFSLPTRPVTAWSRPLSAVLVPTSIAMRLVAGRARRNRWMTYARYLDRFGTHYQAFGWRHFARHAPDARNPHAYYARAWLDELGAPWPDGGDGQ